MIGNSVDKVDSGSELVGQAGQTMEEIVVQVRRVSDIVAEIANAAQEQNTGIVQVNAAVNELDRSTQQNAALVEESAAAAESLQQQAARLAESVRFFNVREQVA